MREKHRILVTREQWDEAAAAYELGTKHGAQIARELCVSAATVSREFQRRGCRKGCRVDEYLAEFLARLDAEAEARARVKAAAERERKKAVSRLIDELFDAMDAVNEAGELLSENPEVIRIGKALQAHTS